MQSENNETPVTAVLRTINIVTNKWRTSQQIAVIEVRKAFLKVVYCPPPWWVFI